MAIADLSARMVIPVVRLSFVPIAVLQGAAIHPRKRVVIVHWVQPKPHVIFEMWEKTLE